jgi:LCP family protein required for cell wall assembly
MGYGSRREDPAGWDRGMDQTAQVRGHDAWDQVAPMRGQRQARPGGRSAAASSGRAGGPRGTRRSQGRGPGQGRGRGAKIRRSRWARFRAKSWLAQVGYVFVVLSAAFIVAVGVTGYAIYQHLEGNITAVKVGGLTGRTVYGELNILVLGSQERAGQHGYFGVGAGATTKTDNSDNLLLVHLDATHTHATILSIPRDLFVYEPGCKARNSFIGYGIQGPYNYPPGNIIDGALNIGGPTCSVETVKDLTGIPLDHVIVFDFNSFRDMVSALGGVSVCVPKGAGYHDGYSGLNLSPGLHRLTPSQADVALAYVRTRHGVGSGVNAGGDLPRIQLQQAFISSMVQQVEHENLFGNIPSLLSLANVATKALTVDTGLKSVSALLHLAKSLAHLKSKNLNLITLPTTMDTYPGLSAHLMAVQPQDDLLYQMVRTGQTWHGHLPVEPYSRVKVYVENGTGQSGLAARTRTKLKALGFDVVGIGDTTATSATTVSFAGEEQAEAAYTLMTALKVSNASDFPAGDNTLNEPASQIGTPGPVTLILGSDFTGVDKPAPVTPAKPAKSAKKKGQHPQPTASTSTPAVSTAIQNGAGAVQSRNAAENICTGLPPAYTPGAQGPG